MGIGADWQYGKSIRLTLAGHHNKVVYIPLFGQGFESAWCRVLLLCAARYMYAMPYLFCALFLTKDRHGKITICIRRSSSSWLLRGLTYQVPSYGAKACDQRHRLRQSSQRFLLLRKSTAHLLSDNGPETLTKEARAHQIDKSIITIEGGHN